MAVQPRSPVVTIMGHVDHGKTSLLDAIRHTTVAAKEAGGITQHIGAYQVEHAKKTITFIDTPGHAAFTKMRSRGAQVTDIVVLVVSATEGVKPQTVESIQHIKAAGVQYLVAITKIDLPDKNIEMVKAQLAEQEVFVEGYGGDIVLVPVSAKTGEGLKKLLEMISLIAEMQELKADPDAPFEGVIIESRKDVQRGAVASVLVKQGTLKVGDTIFAGQVEAKVKAMTDAVGKTIKIAGPSVPVEVLGWSEAPVVGSSISTIKAIAELQSFQSKSQAAGSGEELNKIKLKLIIKSDVAGTLEAIENGVLGSEVILIGKGIGDVNEADVLLAESTGAMIVGFHVKIPTGVKKLAESTKVKVKTYAIIYDLIDELQKQVLKLIEPSIDEEELGTALVSAIFDMRGERVAGCKVQTGEITRGKLYHLKRADVVVADPKMKSMKTGKNDIESAKAGTECGIVFRNFSDVQVGDVVVCYRVKEE
ncbi:MAG: translation initiation factor IF-2 [Patescibacteria group bacterium]